MDKKTLALKTGWKFHYGEEENAWYKGFDDNAWEKVTIPHDWSVHMPFSRDYSSGTGYLAGGIGWYRLHFHVPEEFRGKHLTLVFDGIYRCSRIWVNSYHLADRPYGYSEIAVDVTGLVHFGDQDNVVSVRVERRELADSRWFNGTGLTRKVTLTAEEPLYVQHNSLAFRTVSSDADTAEAEVKFTLQNDGPEASGTVRAELIPAEGTEGTGTAGGTAAAGTEVSLKSGESREILLQLSVSHPALWSDTCPNLYTLRLVFGDSTVMESRRVGLRTIRFDPDHGFFLNGVSEKLRGVCVHEDGGTLGAAMVRDVWLRRLRTLKEAGCNAVRMSHNPHMPELYDLCDELGFLVMDEAFDEWENPKNKWWHGHNVYPPKHDGYASYFPEWYDRDLTDMIRRDRNHPCIVLWSIGNEIDYPNDPYCSAVFAQMTGNNDANKPASERLYDPDKPDASRLPVLAAKLAAVVRREVPDGVVTLAAAFPELSAGVGFLDSLDVAGYNYKEHLYAESHKKYPGRPLIGSENGHSWEAWLAVRDCEYVSGQFLWTGIDYFGESGGTYPFHGSQAGFLATNGLPKSEFGARRVYWMAEPQAYLQTFPADELSGKHWISPERSWNYSDGEQVAVICRTLADSTELYVNGVSAGVQTERTYDGAYLWKVPFKAGTISVKAPADGAAAAEDSIRTAGPAVSLKAELWQDPKADYELLQVIVSLYDSHGNIAITDDRTVEAKAEGGEVAALDSGNLGDETICDAAARKTFRGQLVVYVRPQADSGTITVTSDAGSQTLTWKLP
ncbi:MAG: glycoside hydrolase family 2 TIM barrel-domain containing protein [Lachnospiraceae bacterium]|jgi:beta-galactosidase